MTDSACAPPPVQAPAMTPGTYIRKRREASTLSIDDVAGLLSVSHAGMAAVKKELQQLERDESGWLPDLPYRLRRVFAFDLGVYEGLVLHAADPALPVPHVCRRCACSMHDACKDAAFGPCAWSDRDPYLCTACDRREKAAVEELLDHPDAGMVLTVEVASGDDCPDCGGELGPTFGELRSRTCSTCSTTFLTEEEAGHEA